MAAVSSMTRLRLLDVTFCVGMGTPEVLFALTSKRDNRELLVRVRVAGVHGVGGVRSRLRALSLSLSSCRALELHDFYYGTVVA